MESPATRVVSVKGNPYASRHWLDKHGVAHGAVDWPPVDGEDLESMAMQMHRMGRGRMIDQLYLDTVPFRQNEQRDFRPELVVERPGIGLHAAREHDVFDEIGRAGGLRASLCSANRPRANCRPALPDPMRFQQVSSRERGLATVVA